MECICSGNQHQSCDKTCVHATHHEAHAKGCNCEDCNVTKDPAGGVGCLEFDGCVETHEQVKCYYVKEN